MLKRLVVWMPFILIIGGIIAWSVFYPTHSFRYKITVNVETPEGMKSGFAVREIRARANPNIFPDALPYAIKVRGEAVAVDLGSRGVLFAVMDTDGSRRPILEALPRARMFILGGRVDRRDIEKGIVVMTTKQYPMFVTFTEPQDAKTVIKVDPQNLEETFGQGVSLKDVTIEILDEAITHSIASYLPPLQEEADFVKWRRSLSYGDPLNLKMSNFRRMD